MIGFGRAACRRAAVELCTRPYPAARVTTTISITPPPSSASLRHTAAPRPSGQAALVAGLDETGRGAVVGPLVLAAVVMSKASETFMASIGAKDSKLIQPNRRSQLYEIISCHPGIVFRSRHLTPAEIDAARAAGVNLNELELRESLALLDELHRMIAGNSSFQISGQRAWEKLYIDSVTADPRKYGQAFVDKFPKCDVVCENKADVTFPCVGVASIVAKVQRDDAIRNLEEELGVPIGSGYPSDVETVAFLKQWWSKHRSRPPFVRASWKTIDHLMSENSP